MSEDKIMPAWYGKERYQKGLKLEERIVLVKEENPAYWQISEGKVIESWRKRGRQFFISVHESGRYYVGVVCCKKRKIFSLIADKARKDFNKDVFVLTIPGGEILLKTVIIRKREKLVFLYNLSYKRNNVICMRDESREVEKNLTGAVERFKKMKKEVEKEIPLCFPKTVV